VGGFIEKLKSWWAKKSKTDKVIFLIFFCVGVFLAWQYSDRNAQSTHEISLSQTVVLSKTDVFSKAVVTSDSTYSPPANVITFTVANDAKTVDVNGKDITLTKGQEVKVNVGSMSLKDLSDIGFKIPVEYIQTYKGTDWGKILSSLLGPILMIGFLIYMMGGGLIGGGYKKFKSDSHNIRFSDVGGIAEVKSDLKDVVNYLRDKRYYERVGARIPKGILLIGPPGVGKTLIARAMATEAGVPFYYTGGSDFHNTFFAGVAGMKVKALFKQARKTPSIVFIDEFDAVAHNRNAATGDLGGEMNRTLNQLLAEMDGFKPNQGVIVIAATNRPEVLDPAVTRAGRFDQRIHIGLPNYQERVDILKIHTKDKPLAEDVNLESISKQTGGLSGADLANIVNEAAVFAGRKHYPEIAMADMNEAIDKVTAGEARKSLVVSLSERKVLAYHEAGHAVVSSLIDNGEKVQHISILPHGSAGGFTRMSTEKEDVLLSKSKAMSLIAVLLAGRTAEELIIKDITSGAQSDLQKANTLAYEMIAHFGMGSEYGLRYRSVIEPKDSDDGLINREVNSILNECHEKAKSILSGHNDVLVKVADKLLEVESLDGAELEVLFPLGVQYPDACVASSWGGAVIPRCLHRGASLVG